MFMIIYLWFEHLKIHVTPVINLKNKKVKAGMVEWGSLPGEYRQEYGKTIETWERRKSSVGCKIPLCISDSHP